MHQIGALENLSDGSGIATKCPVQCRDFSFEVWLCLLQPTTHSTEVARKRKAEMDNKTFWRGVNEGRLWISFHNRGLSHPTIAALVDCSIDAPERLLFMTEEQIEAIPCVDKSSLAEIVSYRGKFIRQ
jgi:hypothetical protein